MRLSQSTKKQKCFALEGIKIIELQLKTTIILQFRGNKQIKIECSRYQIAVELETVIILKRKI